MDLSMLSKVGKGCTSGVAITRAGDIVGSLVNEFVAPNIELRTAIGQLEAYMKSSVPGAISTAKELEQALPTVHHFAPSVYGREIRLSKGAIVVGKLHKHSHLNVLAKGRVLVATEDGVEELIAPCVWTSKAHTKRAVQVLEDAVWVCVHPTTTMDLKEIEQNTIAKCYEGLSG